MRAARKCRCKGATYDLSGNRKTYDGVSYATTTGNRLTSDGTYTYSDDSEGNTLTRSAPNDVTSFT